jgi:hypothetical protein
MYELRAWQAGSRVELHREWFADLSAAHIRQKELKAEGYFSWVYDADRRLNCSVWLREPQWT